MMMPVQGSGERKRLLSLVLESSSKIESSINRISLNLHRIGSTFVAYQRKEGSRESEGEREKKSGPSNAREKKALCMGPGRTHFTLTLAVGRIISGSPSL